MVCLKSQRPNQQSFATPAAPAEQVYDDRERHQPHLGSSTSVVPSSSRPWPAASRPHSPDHGWAEGSARWRHRDMRTTGSTHSVGLAQCWLNQLTPRPPTGPHLLCRAQEGFQRNRYKNQKEKRYIKLPYGRLRYSLAVEHFPSICRALGSNLRITKQTKKPDSQTSHSAKVDCAQEQSRPAFSKS